LQSFLHHHNKSEDEAKDMHKCFQTHASSKGKLFGSKKVLKKKKEEKIKTGQSRRTHRHLGLEDKKKRRLESAKKLFSQQKKFRGQTDRQTDRLNTNDQAFAMRPSSSQQI
jgi:predicted metallo-beta-lactamase superfamily hydrolase